MVVKEFTISRQATINTGDYENIKVGIEMTFSVDPGQNVSPGLIDKAAQFVESQLSRQSELYYNMKRKGQHECRD